MAAVSAWITSPASITAPVPARCIKGPLEVQRCIEGGHPRADGQERRNYAGLTAIATTRRRGRGWTPIRAPDARCPVRRGRRLHRCRLSLLLRAPKNWPLTRAGMARRRPR